MAGKKGRSGRPRKPTRLHLIEGTYRKDRSSPNEPQPELIIPKYSRGLSEAAKVYWDEVGNELYLMRILTRADKYLLRLLCDSLVNYDEDVKSLKKHQKIGSQTLTIKLYSKLVRESWNQIMIALREFGLTPSSRTRISAIPEPEENNPWENL